MIKYASIPVLAFIVFVMFFNPKVPLPRQVYEEHGVYVDIIEGIPWNPADIQDEGIAWNPTVETKQVQVEKKVEKNTKKEKKVAIPDGPCAVSSKYPERVYRWCALITAEAKRNGLEPNLIAALILQESGGNPSAYSYQGATGLMQVMAKDGEAERQFPGVFRNRPTMAQLKDPEFNVRYGTKMLAGLVRRYGNVRDALKYYGPMGTGYRYADIVLGHYARYK